MAILGANIPIKRYEFELEVMVTGKPSFKVTHVQQTPIDLLDMLSKDVILPVKVHLEKPKRLPNVWNQVATRNIDDIKKEY